MDFELILKVKPGFFARKFGVRFDMLCFFRLMEELGIQLGDEIGELGKKPVDELLTTAIFTGAESYAFHHKQKLIVSKDKIAQWVDDSVITRKQYRELLELWMRFMQTFQDEDKKKQKANR